MTEPFQINPQAVYDDGTMRLALGLTESTTTRARRDGKLKYSRKGNRVLYLGQWIIDWIASDVQEEVANA